MSKVLATRIKTCFRKDVLAIFQGMFPIDGWKRGLTMTDLESAAHELFQPGNATTTHNTGWRQSQIVKANGNEWKRAKGKTLVQNTEILRCELL